MSSSALFYRVNRTLALLALASVSALGMFGHSLHSLLPCGDGACGIQAAAAVETCCCCHHCAAEEAAADGPRVTKPGHDAENCPLCTLLAQMKVSRPSQMIATIETVAVVQPITLVETLQVQQFDLSAAPRGPPLA